MKKLILFLFVIIHSAYCGRVVDIEAITKENSREHGFNIEIIGSRYYENNSVIKVKLPHKDNSGKVFNSSTIYLRSNGKTILGFNPNITIKDDEKHFSFEVESNKIKNMIVLINYGTNITATYQIVLSEFTKK